MLNRHDMHRHLNTIGLKQGSSQFGPVDRKRCDGPVSPGTITPRLGYRNGAKRHLRRCFSVIGPGRLSLHAMLCRAPQAVTCPLQVRRSIWPSSLFARTSGRCGCRTSRTPASIRVIELLERGLPAVDPRRLQPSGADGCLATHIAWNHLLEQWTLEAGIMWLSRVAGLNPATSQVIRAGTGGTRDWELRSRLLENFKEERERQAESPAARPERESVLV